MSLPGSNAPPSLTFSKRTIEDSDGDSMTAVSVATVPEVSMDRHHQEQDHNHNHPGGGIIDAVLLLIVRGVLAGVQGYAVVEWLLGRISEALVWIVELGLLLVQPAR